MIFGTLEVQVDVIEGASACHRCTANAGASPSCFQKLGVLLKWVSLESELYHLESVLEPMSFGNPQVAQSQAPK